MNPAPTLLACVGLAVSALAPAATAQESEVPTLPVGPMRHMGEPFSDRAIVPVYGVTGTSCTTTPFAIGNGASYVVEDVSFHPGIFGNSFPAQRIITQVEGMFQCNGWTGTPIYPETSTPQFFITHVFEFWDQGSFTAAPMLSATTPFATRSIPTNFGNGFAWPYTATLNPVVDAGTRVNLWVAIRAIDPSTGARVFDGNTSLQQPAGQSAVVYGTWLGRVGDVCIGHTEPDYGRDQNPPTPFTGAFAGGTNFIVGTSPGNTNDRRRTAADFAAGARSLSLALWGDCPFTECGGPPPSPEVICPVPDGPTARTWTPVVSGAVVKWYQLCLNAPVTDDSLRYLSIDTEGSSQAAALALYNDAGTLLATDDGSGSGTNSQLTFGVGRSAGVSDGAQYDGRDGQLPAGTYYLALAGTGSFFQTAFEVTPSVVGLQPVSLNLRTNATAGGNLPPLVTPVINHADFPTPWAFPATDTLQGNAGPSFPHPSDDASSAVLWSRFTLAAPGASDAGLTSTYLDIDAGFSALSDNVLFLFNSAGDLLAFSDDQSLTTFLPLLSFGAANPLRSVAAGNTRGPNNDPSAMWRGENGDLPPGTYYLASAAWPADVLTGQGGSWPVLGPNRRFHVRGLSGNNIDHALRFYTGTGFNCDSIDFNNDGLFPDTLDIDDFLSVFSGGPCSNDPLCGDIDINNDGLFPDTLDIDAFLSVFSGGPCLR